MVYHELNRGQHYATHLCSLCLLMSSAPSCACSTYTSATVECPGVPSRLGIDAKSIGYALRKDHVQVRCTLTLDLNLNHITFDSRT